MISKKNKSNTSINSKGLVLSLLFGIVFFVLCGLAVSFLLVKKDINIESVKYLWILISAVSGLICGLFAGKLNKTRGIIWGSLSSLLLSLVIFLIIVIYLKFNIIPFTFIIIPICILFGAIGGIISSNLKK